MVWRLNETLAPLYRPEMEIPADDKEMLVAAGKQVRNKHRLIFDSPHLSIGYPYPDLHRPIRLVFKSRHKSVPNFVSALEGWAISKSVVDVIEAFEPGVHRFFPVDITMKGGAKPDEPYFYLNVCQRLETISVEHSTVVVMPSAPGREYITFKDDVPEKLVCEKTKIGSHHLWCEYKHWKALFASNELAAAFEALGTSGLQLTYAADEI